MIRILGKISNDVNIACSGGPDSMSVLDFLLKGRKRVTVAHFDHGTEHGAEARMFVEDYCSSRNIPFVIGEISRDPDPEESTEEYWRNERYRFFKTLPGETITAHHLDDVAEWYLFSSLHGKGRVIPYKRECVIRPFLTTPKEHLVDWCKRKDVPYIIDPSNKDERFMRSIIRNKIFPEALRVNPGLRRVVKNMVERDFNRLQSEKMQEIPVC